MESESIPLEFKRESPDLNDDILLQTEEDPCADDYLIAILGKNIENSVYLQPNTIYDSKKVEIRPTVARTSSVSSSLEIDENPDKLFKISEQGKGGLGDVCTGQRKVILQKEIHRDVGQIHEQSRQDKMVDKSHNNIDTERYIGKKQYSVEGAPKIKDDSYISIYGQNESFECPEYNRKQDISFLLTLKEMLMKESDNEERQTALKKQMDIKYDCSEPDKMTKNQNEDCKLNILEFVDKPQNREIIRQNDFIVEAHRQWKPAPQDKNIYVKNEADVNNSYEMMISNQGQMDPLYLNRIQSQQTLIYHRNIFRQQEFEGAEEENKIENSKEALQQSYVYNNRSDTAAKFSNNNRMMLNDLKYKPVGDSFKETEAQDKSRPGRRRRLLDDLKKKNSIGKKSYNDAIEVEVIKNSNIKTARRKLLDDLKIKKKIGIPNELKEASNHDNNMERSRKLLDDYINNSKDKKKDYFNKDHCESEDTIKYSANDAYFEDYNNKKNTATTKNKASTETNIFGSSKSSTHNNDCERDCESESFQKSNNIIEINYDVSDYNISDTKSKSSKDNNVKNINDKHYSKQINVTDKASDCDNFCSNTVDSVNGNNTANCVNDEQVLKKDIIRFNDKISECNNHRSNKNFDKECSINTINNVNDQLDTKQNNIRFNDEVCVCDNLGSNKNVNKGCGNKKNENDEYSKTTNFDCKTTKINRFRDNKTNTKKRRNVESDTNSNQDKNISDCKISNDDGERLESKRRTTNNCDADNKKKSKVQKNKIKDKNLKRQIINKKCFGCDLLPIKKQKIVKRNKKTDEIDKQKLPRANYKKSARNLFVSSDNLSSVDLTNNYTIPEMNKDCSKASGYNLCPDVINEVTHSTAATNENLTNVNSNKQNEVTPAINRIQNKELNNVNDEYYSHKKSDVKKVSKNRKLTNKHETVQEKDTEGDDKMNSPKLIVRISRKEGDQKQFKIVDDNSKTKAKGRRCTLAQIQRAVEFKKHVDYIKLVLRWSNATPIRRFANGGYVCAFCDVQCHKPYDLKKHTLHQHHDCKEAYFAKGIHDLYKFYIKLDITDFQCRICFEKRENVEDMIDHFHFDHGKKTHRNIKNHIVTFKFDKDDVDKLSCYICSATYENFKVLSEHVISSHFRNYICAICEKGFVNRKKLETHIKIHATSVFNCQFCGKIFETVYEKSSHEKAHESTREGGWHCVYCNAKFEDHFAKERHMESEHDLELPRIVCQACDRFFTTRAEYSDHVRRDHLME